MSLQPTVAVTVDFMKSLAALPKQTQKKVREFVQKFQANPTATSINYEKLASAFDEKVRSVRIDQEYRGIVIHPEEGDTYILTWVDHHDEAMDWARRKRFDIHPQTGAFQVLPSDEEVARITEGLDDENREQTPSTPMDFRPGVFREVSDEDFVGLGIPDALIPIIRKIQTDAQIEALSELFPGETTDALFLLGAGATVAEILAEREAAAEATLETDSEASELRRALDHPDTKRWVKVVDGQQELAEILSAPLELWRVFLHPSQATLVRRHFKGPARVFGGAGTGKTVVAMHRARYLATEVYKAPGQRILFTTYTRNLSDVLRQNLATLCGQEFDRIDVSGIDAWAANTLRTLGVSFNVLSGKKQKDDLWSEAEGVIILDGLSLEFLRDEWEAVIQAQGLETMQEYIRADRSGRGVPLRRTQRMAAWELFQEYRRLLQERNLFEYEDVIRELRKRLESELRPPLPYRTVVVDEVQDMTPERLRLIRAIVPPGENDLFFVGDPHQRIYGRPLVFSRLGIEIRGRSRKLKVNYRTTGAIRRFSMRVLHGIPFDDMDGGVDSLDGTHALREGIAPQTVHLADEAAQDRYLIQQLRGLLTRSPTITPEAICVAAPTNAQVKRLAEHLASSNLPALVVSTTDDQWKQPGIRVCTYHRAKGLEFTHVFMTYVNRNIVPRPYTGNPEDQVGRVEHDARQRALFHVVCTRARDELVVLSYGESSEYIR